MKHGSLFSGIGGFDLAAEWMGWENVFHCEWNEFGKKVLKHYWPNAISYSDITKTDFSIHRGGIDILTGGFPCQPYSAAGKRKGTADDRHLWPEMLRAVREIQPRYVVGENVRGLTNWNGGLVFDQVQADLEAEGFEVLPFLLPACALNAPHRRDRIWFVAKSCGIGCDNGSDYRKERHFYRDIRLAEENKPERERWQCWARENSTTTSHSENDPRNGEFQNEGGAYQAPNERSISPHTNETASNGNQIGLPDEKQIREMGWLGHRGHDVRDLWEKFPTESPVCNGDDGLSSRLDGITFSKWREESIKAGGNAIVWSLAYQIFKSIQETDSLTG